MNINQYEKFAIVAFRLLGISVFVMGVICCCYALLFLLPASFSTALSYIVPSLLYLVFGGLLFVLSKPLAALTVKGLKDE